jgi:hypothetical protein
MPAVSKAQRNLMGMALAYRRGKLKESELPKSVAGHIRRLAADKSVDLEAFASTPERSLPQYKRSNTTQPIRARGARVARRAKRA